MRVHLVVIPALAAMALTSSARAQRAGNVELGAFGQYSFMDSKWALKDAFGFGGRLGVYLTPRWELEADVASASLKPKPPLTGGNVQYLTYAGRLVFGVPVDSNAFLLELGAGNDRVGSSTKFAVTPGVGFRWNFSDILSLRVDGLVDFVTSSPQTTNVLARGGFSLLLGEREAPPPPPPVINQDSIDQARRRDSIARAEAAARERARQDSIAAAAKARQDSIDAAMRARQDSIAAAERARAEVTARLSAELETKIHFAFNRSVLRNDAKAALDAKLPIMMANPALRIRIEGNADERGPTAYNKALGLRRAEQARRYLVSKGIDATRIDVVSNGEGSPVCTEHAESCWSQNRRDEFVIVAGGEDLKPGN